MQSSACVNGVAPREFGSLYTLVYGAPEHYDTACFAALHELARQMTERGLRFAVVMTPLSPVWKATVDSNGQARQRLEQGVQHALLGTNATFWNADAGYQPAAEAFTDAIHLRGSAIAAFTQAVLAHVGF